MIQSTARITSQIGPATNCFLHPKELPIYPGLFRCSNWENWESHLFRLGDAETRALGS